MIYTHEKQLACTSVSPGTTGMQRVCATIASDKNLIFEFNMVRGDGWKFVEISFRYVVRPPITNDLSDLTFN